MRRIAERGFCSRENEAGANTGAALRWLRSRAAPLSGGRESSSPPAPPRTAPLPKALPLATRHASPTGAARHPAGLRRHRRWQEWAGSALGPEIYVRREPALRGPGDRRAHTEGSSQPRAPRPSQRAPEFWGSGIRAGAPQGPHSKKAAAAAEARPGRLAAPRGWGTAGPASAPQASLQKTHNTKTAPGASRASRRPYLEIEAEAAPETVGVTSFGRGRVVTAGGYRGLEPRSPRGSTGTAAAARCWISAAVAN